MGSCKQEAHFTVYTKLYHAVIALFISRLHLHQFYKVKIYWQRIILVLTSDLCNVLTKEVRIVFLLEICIQNAAHRTKDFLYWRSTENIHVVIIFYCEVKYVYADGRTS